MKKLVFSLYCMLVCYNVLSQVPGTWNEYFSYRSVTQIENVDDNIFALCDNGLFIYNTTSQEIQKISKVNGLSTVGLTCMAFCDSTSTFLIGYSDGTLDILAYPSLKVTSIPTIAQKSLYGSKKINKIVMQSDTAVIATEFGVLSLSMREKKFISTSILSNDGSYVAVKSVTLEADTVYAATVKGIFSATITKNISDFSNWKKLTGIPFEGDTINHIAVLNGAIYYAHNKVNELGNTLFRIKDGTCEPFKVSFSSIRNIKVRNEELLIASSYCAAGYDKDEKVIFYQDTSSFKMWYYTDVIYMDSECWCASKSNGILHGNTPCMPKGPQTNMIADMQYYGNDLHVVEGNSDVWDYGYYDRKSVNGYWTGHKNWDVIKSVCVLYHPKTTKYYYGTLGSGLVESEHTWNYSKIYTNENSILQGFQSNKTVVSISDMTYDKNYNIWLINYGAASPIVMIDQNNKWKSFEVDNGSRGNIFNHILVDSRGFKWLTGTNKLIVFTENNTIDDVSDDAVVSISLTDNEGVIASSTTCVAEDLDGEIWVGTNQGIAVHSSPSRVFKDKQSISRIKIEIDGEVGYLLSSESITCIAVDGANRKWIGTENSGVFLISKNGTEQIKHFTKANSPLPSNAVTSIVISKRTGEVYFGTVNGLVSYVGDATAGDIEMKNVFVYPNPVRDSYDGEIYINGVVTDATIKITDVSGNLVKTLESNGGTAVWDGRNTLGERVQTGVYMVYISDDSGTNTKVEKILFIH